MTARRIVLVDIGEGLTLSGMLPSVALHGSYSTKLIARGGVAPYTFTTSSTLPDGLTLDRATGVFSATDVATPGTFPIVVTVTDITGATAARNFVLQVIAQPLVATGHAPNGTVGVAYSYTYAATGGTPPYTWAIASGALPAGLSLNDATGEISGTPTVGGAYTWTVRLSDAGGKVFDRIDGASYLAAPLTLSGTYPNGTVGVAYSADLSIAGGVPPYSNPRVISGTLPAGLSLSIVGNQLRLSGTPSVAGTSAATLAVDDAVATTANTSVAITTTSAADPLWPYVKSLLRFNGAPGATTISDDVPGMVWTRRAYPSDSGALQLSSDVVLAPPTALKAPTADVWFETSDFIGIGSTPHTLEAVAYLDESFVPSPSYSDYRPIFGRPNGQASGEQFFLLYGSAEARQLMFSRSSSFGTYAKTINSGHVVPSASWVHYAFDFDGSVIRLFVDGVMVAKSVDTRGMMSGGNFQLLQSDVAGYDAYRMGFGGYCQTFRATVGVSRYGSDASFTPPSLPLPVG